MTAPETYEVFAIRYATRQGQRRDHFVGGDPHDAVMPMVAILKSSAAPSLKRGILQAAAKFDDKRIPEALLLGWEGQIAGDKALREDALRVMAGRKEWAQILMSFGLLSVVLSALFLWRQRDIKRLFAYSSIEHMGLITFAFGMGGPVANFAGLLHMTVHSLTKSAIFFTVGHAAQHRVTRPRPARIEPGRHKGLVEPHVSRGSVPAGEPSAFGFTARAS